MVGEGVQVAKGQQLGTTGNSGNSSGYHLHFECSNSGEVWGGSGENRFKYRMRNRINPMYFYPTGSFTGNTDPWDEVFWWDTDDNNLPV